MIVTCAEMRAAEQRCFASGIEAGALMEEASAGIASAIRQFFPTPGRLVLFLGGGNNAGDAIVAARILREAGWRVLARQAVDQLGPLAGKKLEELGEKGFEAVTDIREIITSAAADGGPLVLVDGLVGIGAHGALRSPLAEAAEQIRVLRSEAHASVVAVDIPSGVDGDSGEVYSGAVAADITCTVGAVKAGLLADCATSHVGRLVVIPLKDLDLGRDTGATGSTGRKVLTAAGLRRVLPGRGFEFHKGEAGRVGIVAGSRGMFGAACLASEAALRAGAGLVTLYVDANDYDLVVGMVVPEVMVSPVSDLGEVSGRAADALAIGPGIGRGRDAQVLRLCREAKLPAVLDADALNVLAENAAQGGELCQSMAGPRLLTPHPGEMARLLGEGQISDRAGTVRDFVRRHNQIALLLKGARTLVGAEGFPLACNSTGTPGMASGGMGDVLSGVAAALLARGCSPYDAGCLAAWLCGRAAERALSDGGESVESLVASCVCAHLGAAFDDLREGTW